LGNVDRTEMSMGQTHEFHTFAGAGHAFMNHLRPSYREQAATDAWPKCVGWLDRYLKA
jgi:carboxymethylenebutenolidase